MLRLILKEQRKGTIMTNPLDLMDITRRETLRDYFAAAALPALITNFLSKDLDLLDPLDWMEGLSMDAYSMADAMLKQRSEK